MCTKSNLQLAPSLDAALTATVLHVWGAEGSSTTKLTPPSLGKSIECLVVSCGPAQAPLKNPNEAMMTIWPAFPLSSGMPAGIHTCEHTHCRKIRIPDNEPTQTSFEPSPTVCHPHCAMNLTATRRTFAHDAAPFRRRASLTVRKMPRPIAIAKPTTPKSTRHVRCSRARTGAQATSRRQPQVGKPD